MKSSVERLESLLEFAAQTAMLRSQPSRTIAQHKNFYRFEEQMQGLPGLHFGSDAGDGSWLNMERLVESKPPKPEQAMLALWLDLSSDPDKEPSLKNSVAVDDLVAIGAITPISQIDMVEAENVHGVPGRIRREDFSERDVLDNLFTAYKDVIWKKWAAEERERRKSIKLYASLFALYQQMQGNLGDTPLELVWGIGVAVWSDSQGDIKYPIISQLVEIMLDEGNMSLLISPRSNMKPILEVGAYDAHENPGLARLAETTKKHFEDIGNAVSPFEPSTYESVLRSAVTLLDAQGVYWPNETSADDRSVPSSKEHLTVTDTWVFFARPRSSNLFIQDIKRFESQLGEVSDLPSAVAAIVTDPSTKLEEEVLPSFRGMSFVGGHGVSSSRPSGAARELYFPLPYNDEQVQIVQRLEAHDGVVVQGPPGTGKTHTIANVICHYLASGKRVLVTSMKDPALAVLRDKIPEEIRPLAISLLTSEAEGMRQFEFAINKIATEIQQINRSAYRRDIDRIEGDIEALHATIARTDRDIAEWAKRNIECFKMDDESIRPEEAAKLVSENRDNFAWLPDPVSIDSQHSPQFTDED